MSFSSGDQTPEAAVGHRSAELPGNAIADFQDRSDLLYFPPSLEATQVPAPASAKAARHCLP
jgi:hypothetical protein